MSKNISKSDKDSKKSKKQFKKILVANRGEIACRIIRTLNKINIASVAVYSEFDFNSPHVLMADEAVCVGKANLSESYLNPERIINAAIATNSEAVHPGFGFFAENYQFAKCLNENGIDFIGPSYDSIALMSDKIRAKELAKNSGLSVVDGYIGVINNAEHAEYVIEQIGLPVLIKAAGGGGGKGMRIVRSRDDITDSIINAQNEALKNFADGRVFIEKFIEKPRHIEIQVLADKFGNSLCLGERECSIQRKYQKVIEEAPSPFVTESMREAMYEQSMRLIKEVGYYSAGTIEYIVDSDRNFYFMEMNTRIQVEHAVTEMVTGVDIVEEMINVALGKKLSFSQNDVKIFGHSVEARIYAENPEKGFLPTTGFITEYKEPAGIDIRVDSGVCEGIEVSTYYDAMLAKVCTYGSNRNDAIKTMKVALEKLVIDGVITNIVFLQSIFSHHQFLEANIYTGFIDDYYSSGLPKDFKLEKSAIKVFIAVALYSYCYKHVLSFENFALENKRFVAVILDKKIDIIADFKDHELIFTYSSKKYSAKMKYSLRSIFIDGKINNETFVARCKSNDLDFNIEYLGIRLNVRVLPQEIQELYDNYNLENESEANNYVVKSPITGIISKIYVQPGSETKKGDPLFVIESMKMENTFTAEIFGKVAKVVVNEGSIVQEGDLVLEYSKNL